MCALRALSLVPSVFLLFVCDSRSLLLLRSGLLAGCSTWPTMISLVRLVPAVCLHHQGALPPFSSSSSSSSVNSRLSSLSLSLSLCLCHHVIHRQQINVAIAVTQRMGVSMLPAAALKTPGHITPQAMRSHTHTHTSTSSVGGGVWRVSNAVSRKVMFCLDVS